MKHYVDTSVFIGWFHPADAFSPAVVAWFQENGGECSWNSVLRAEVRHHLRGLKGNYAAVAWHAYRAAETTGLLMPDRQPLSNLLERADELSAQYAQIIPAGTWDFVHVAAAAHARAKIFVTCDDAQASLAKAAGISQVKLFKA